MPQIENPFTQSRPTTIGELEHRLAAYAKTLAFNAGITLTTAEEEAVAKVIGAILRAHPWIKEWIKNNVPGLIGDAP